MCWKLKSPDASLIFLGRETVLPHVSFTISPARITAADSKSRGLMRALEILSQQMEIFHRGRDLRVAEDDREAHNVATVAEVLGRKGVTPIPCAE